MRKKFSYFLDEAENEPPKDDIDNEGHTAAKSNFKVIQKEVETLQIHSTQTRMCQRKAENSQWQNFAQKLSMKNLDWYSKWFLLAFFFLLSYPFSQILTVNEIEKFKGEKNPRALVHMKKSFSLLAHENEGKVLAIFPLPKEKRKCSKMFFFPFAEK